jgi:UTP:GlnB (protein PII) uridylyltransferase
MPAAYAQAFSLSQAAEHAEIVARRGAMSAHAELWRELPGAPLLCVVADDQPGLLSFVTDALLSHGLNIKTARVYCRRRGDGTFEAVDFFHVQRSGGKVPEEDVVEPAELSSFAQTLRELIAEDRLTAQQPRERDTIPVPGPKPSRYYFDLEALRRGEFVLIVETPDFPGLLFAISSALHGQSVRILASEAKTEDGFARDRFTLESANREPITAERLCDVQQAVGIAVAAARPSRPFAVG